MARKKICQDGVETALILPGYPPEYGQENADKMGASGWSRYGKICLWCRHLNHVKSWCGEADAPTLATATCERFEGIYGPDGA